MIRTASLGVTALLMLAHASALASPRNDNPAEYRGFSANLPACDDPAVLGNITSAFGAREATYAGGALALTAYQRVSTRAWRPWGNDFIPRRFCSAKAYFSDGRYRQVDYSVRDGLGLMGWTWNVNWCVQGLDRHWTYQADCTMARP